jgi:LacI family transcriptional regulator
VFINTDLVAIGALTEFKNQGVRVPEDIKVVGFSNWFMSSVISPSLTTIDQPGYQMGEAAFCQLYKEIKSNRSRQSQKPKIIELETSLVERESTT